MKQRNGTYLFKKMWIGNQPKIHLAIFYRLICHIGTHSYKIQTTSGIISQKIRQYLRHEKQI